MLRKERVTLSFLQVDTAVPVLPMAPGCLEAGQLLETCFPFAEDSGVLAACSRDPGWCLCAHPSK